MLNVPTAVNSNVPIMFAGLVGIIASVKSLKQPAHKSTTVFETSERNPN